MAGVLLSLQLGLASEDGNDPSSRFAPVIDLPPGEGKELISIACTRCHTLEGLEAYKGYWNRDQWFAMVESMVKNGAQLDVAQMELVTEYLTKNFGSAMRK